MSGITGRRKLQHSLAVIYRNALLSSQTLFESVDKFSFFESVNDMQEISVLRRVQRGGALVLVALRHQNRGDAVLTNQRLRYNRIPIKPPRGRQAD